MYKVNSAKATKAVTIFENTLWNSTSDKYVPIKCPVAKHQTVRLNASSKYPNSTTREITVYDDESDCDNLNSCDSDYEENIPLCYLIHDEAKSPISSCTCTHLNRKPWICSTLEPLKLDLNDYERPIIQKSSKIKTTYVHSKSLKTDELMLSGIQPLTPGEGSSGLGNEIMMVNSDGSNSDVFASEVRYSMPKKGEVIDLTQMPICSISPIIHREENNSEVIHDQIMSNKEDELSQSP